MTPENQIDEIKQLRQRLVAEQEACEKTKQELDRLERKQREWCMPMDLIASYCESHDYIPSNYHAIGYEKETDDSEFGEFIYYIGSDDSLCYNFVVYASDEDQILVNKNFNTQEELLECVQSYSKPPELILTMTTSVKARTESGAIEKLSKLLHESRNYELTSFKGFSITVDKIY